MPYIPLTEAAGLSPPPDEKRFSVHYHHRCHNYKPPKLFEQTDHFRFLSEAFIFWVQNYRQDAWILMDGKKLYIPNQWEIRSLIEALDDNPEKYLKSIDD